MIVKQICPHNWMRFHQMIRALLSPKDPPVEIVCSTPAVQAVTGAAESLFREVAIDRFPLVPETNRFGFPLRSSVDGSTATRLRIAMGAAEVMVSRPAPAAGFLLQKRSSLAPALWVVEEAVNRVGDLHQALITSEGEFDGGGSARQALLPFFSKIFQKCGKDRPDWLPQS